MAGVWFVRGGGKVYGPFDSVKFKKIVEDRKIDQTTEIAQNQNGPWVPAGKVKGLFEAHPVTPAYAPKPQAYAAPQPYIRHRLHRLLNPRPKSRCLPRL